MADSSKIYPRGVPFMPPDELANKEASLRRWTRALIVGGVAVVFLVVGSGFYFVSQMNRRFEQALADKAAADKPAPEKPKQEPVANFIAPPEKDGKATPSKDRKAGAKEPPPGPGARLASKNENSRDRFLSMIGQLTGVHLYQSYLNIGLLADCTEGEIYTTEDAQKWLERTVAQLELVDKQLDTLAKQDLDPEEKLGVERCRKASSLLRVQATELKEYWKKSDQAHADSYHKAREAAWNAVSDVLSPGKDEQEMSKE